MSQLVWHYTYGHHIEEILATGTLLPPARVASLVEEAHNGHGTREYESDKKMLLFSSNPYWEPASYRAIMENGVPVELHQRSDYEKRGLKIIRFGVDRSILKPWVKLKRLAHMPKGMAQSLEDLAYKLGSNPYDWWGTLFPVPRAEWQTVEVLESDTWEQVSVEVA